MAEDMMMGGGLLGAAMQQQMPQQMPQEARPQQRGGDQYTQAATQVAMEQLQQASDAIMQQLTDGQGDIELEIAETAGNILAATQKLAQQDGREIPTASLQGVVMRIIAELVKMAMQGQVLERDEAKAIAQRAVPMALAIYKQGPGSIEGRGM